MGSDWLAAPVWWDWLNRLTSLTLAACALGCIVEKAVVNIAYQFEPGWDAEDISEEDRAEWLVMVCFVVSYF